MPRSRSLTSRPPPREGSTRAGTWIKQGTGKESFWAFSPKALPPDPPLAMDAALQRRLEVAGLALGRLDGIGRLLPKPDDLLYSYIRKEAVLSSQIEGTQSSLADLLLHENSGAPGVPLEDVQEVSNYIAALEQGMTLLERLPVSLRMLKGVRQVLVAGRRGHTKTPGEFRKRQNWIGGPDPASTMFVPPPGNEVNSALGALEKFIHSAQVPVLIKVASSTSSSRRSIRSWTATAESAVC